MAWRTKTVSFPLQHWPEVAREPDGGWKERIRHTSRGDPLHANLTSLSSSRVYITGALLMQFTRAPQSWLMGDGNLAGQVPPDYRQIFDLMGMNGNVSCVPFASSHTWS